MRRHMSDRSIPLIDLTMAEAVICVMGPSSQALLQHLFADDFSNATKPFGTCQNLEIGLGRARTYRVSYVGKNG